MVFGAWNRYRVAGWASTTSKTTDHSQIDHPPSSQVYNSSAVGTEIQYDIPLTSGRYDIRLHFPRDDRTNANTSVAVFANRTLAIKSYDFGATDDQVGRSAVAASFTVDVSDGDGLLLELRSNTDENVSLSAIEITQPNVLVDSAPTVNLDLSINHGVDFERIAGATDLPTNARGRGTFVWAASPSSDDASNVVRITSNSATMLSDESDNSFSISNATNVFYVNDDSTENDQYTTAVGDDANNGKSPSQPMASLQSLLAFYDLEPGDTVYVDTGIYTLDETLVFDAQDTGAPDNRLVIQGPTDADKKAVLDGPSSEGGAVIRLQDSRYVTLDNISVTGAQTGILLSGDEGTIISNSHVYGNVVSGIASDTPADIQIVSSFIEDNGGFGIDIEGKDNATIRDNTVLLNGTGINASQSVTISGNVVHSNLLTGIVAGEDTVVHSNQVYAHNNADGAGISAERQSGRISENSVHGNYRGIFARTSANINQNQVFNNTSVGIDIAEGSAASVTGNHVYSNRVGVYSFRGQTIANNVIHDNVDQGIVIEHGARLVNNTIYQESGDAVRIVDGNSVTILNNILSVQAGAAISIEPSSLSWTRSDYNVFQSPQNRWNTVLDGVPLNEQAAWYLESGFDRNSKVADPLFVDLGGEDNVRGYSLTPLGDPVVLGVQDATFLGDGWAEPNSLSSIGDLWSTRNLDDRVSWSFEGLDPGTYQIAATWSDASRTDAARYTISQGEQVLLSNAVNHQKVSPDDFVDSDIDWGVVGYVQVAGGRVDVELNNDSKNRYIGSLTVDAVRLQRIVGDKGGDDLEGFKLQQRSPAIDAGDPGAAYLSEPVGGGGRINAGAFGNTSDAAPSADKYVQVISPNGFERFEQGEPVSIEWRSWGLSPEYAIETINVGGDTTESWREDDYRIQGGVGRIKGDIDTSFVQEPPPQAVYQTHVCSNPETGEPIEYDLPIADGDYQLRLHFVDDIATVGTRLFDIFVNGVLVADDFDVAAEADGVPLRAVAETFQVQVADGEGLSLVLVSDNDEFAILSGIEITRDNPDHSPETRFQLDLSQDAGSTFSPLPDAQLLMANSTGRGVFQWTATEPTTWGALKVRVSASDQNVAPDTSDHGFMIVDGGNTFYVNDDSLVGDQYTTAVGDNRNSGKSPSEPMTSLASLQMAHDLGAGDIVYVDTGSYTLLRDVQLGNWWSGNDNGDADNPLIIQGPTDAGNTAVLSRNGSGRVFNISHGIGIVIDSLSITGADLGVRTWDSRGNVVISNNHIHGNGRVGVWGDDWYFHDGEAFRIQNNLIENNGESGVISWGPSVIDGNTVSGNGKYGIWAKGEDRKSLWTTVSNNKVYDNADSGIYGKENVLIERNEVYGHANASGILASSGKIEVRQNILHSNRDGINSVYFSYAAIEDNHVFNNSRYGIYSRTGATIDANTIYSNETGIFARDEPGIIQNNLVYANTVRGVEYWRVSEPQNRFINNTVYQIDGDALKIRGASIDIHNNILWSSHGTALNVVQASLANVESDHNLFYVGSDGIVARWNHDTSSLAEWQRVTSLDQNSVHANPQFLDVDGADNVLGYATVDSGADDNFTLSSGSPAIDQSPPWYTPESDRLGNRRQDDFGKVSLVKGDYEERLSGKNAYAAVGEIQAHGGDDEHLSVGFDGFTFPFYDYHFDSVNVTRDGVLYFRELPANEDSEDGDQENDTPDLEKWPSITPLSDDLHFGGDGDGVFIDDSIANQLTIRWNASLASDDSDVQFSTTLLSTGEIQFHYGPGNSNLSPTIGISRGDGRNQVVSTYSGQSELANVSSVSFARTAPAIGDIGAFEFIGSSLDVTAPMVVGSFPVGVDSSASVAAFQTLTLTFSEQMNAREIVAIGNYELRDPGLDQQLGTQDDNVFPLTPTLTAQTNTVALRASKLIEPGSYRLTIPASSMHDVSANGLDGNADGVGGDDYVRDFVVVASEQPPELVSIETHSPNPTSAEDLRFLVTFDTNVHNVDAFDFVVDSLASADVSSVSEISPTVYAVHVNGDFSSFDGLSGPESGCRTRHHRWLKSTRPNRTRDRRVLFCFGNAVGLR